VHALAVAPEGRRDGRVTEADAALAVDYHGARQPERQTLRMGVAAQMRRGRAPREQKHDRSADSGSARCRSASPVHAPI